MECDVTPDCPQEINPLGNLIICDPLAPTQDDLNYVPNYTSAEIIANTEQTFKKSTNPQPPPSPSTATTTTTITIIKPSPKTIEPVIKHHHSLRRNIPRIIVKPIPPPPPPIIIKKDVESIPIQKIKNLKMHDDLGLIPDFSIKPRRKTNKKLSTAAKIEQTREGCIDLETPDSILVGTNLRSLLNKHTFSSLPPLYQYKLVQLLPSYDRPQIDLDSSAIRLSTSTLNNEFFARACLEWRERLSEGEFTPENQLKLKSEAEREKNKLDPWKLKHFEPIWGDKGQSNSQQTKNKDIALPQRPSLKTTIKLRPTTSIATSTTSTNFTSSGGSGGVGGVGTSSNNSGRINKSVTTSPVTPKRVRTVGAVTRAVTGSLQQSSPSPKMSNPVPDLLPIRTKVPRALNSFTNTPSSIEFNENIEQLEKRDEMDGQMDEMPISLHLPPLVPFSDEKHQEIPENLEIHKTPIKYSTKRSRTPENSQSKVCKMEEMDTTETEEPELQEINQEDIDYDCEQLENISDQQKYEDDHNLDDFSASASVSSSKDDSDENYQPKDENSTNSENNLENFVENMEAIRNCTKNLENNHIFNNSELIHQNNFDGVLQNQNEEEIHELQERYDEEEEEEEQHQPLQQIDEKPNNLMDEDHEVGCKDDDGSSFVESSVVTCDEGSNSTSNLVDDCSAENSVDTAVDDLEPSIQNIPLEEDDEQKLTDAENYVLESGEIEVQSTGERNNLHHIGQKLCVGDDIQADLFAAAVAKALESVPNVPVAMTVVNPGENTEIIPMQETLEVRLEESSFQIPTGWPFDVKMETNLIGDAVNGVDVTNENNENIKYSTGAQVKLELEVTLTPETEVTSTVINNNSSSSDGDHSNSENNSNTSMTLPTVIPPTTIVCLPSISSNSIHQSFSMAPNGISIRNFTEQSFIKQEQPQQQQQQQQQQQILETQQINKNDSIGPGKVINTNNLSNSNSPKLQMNQRVAIVASSSSVPFLSISSNQPLRAVVPTQLQRPKTPNRGGGRGNRANSNRPPPGAVNLERSYQICQAVIQKSANREQLSGQLRPPPSLLTPNTTGQNQAANVLNKVKMETDQTQYSAVTSSNKLIATNRMNFGGKKSIVQRQPSPMLVRHVFTSNQGIPVSMAILPSTGTNQQMQAQQHQINMQTDNQTGHLMNNVGQYVLVQRAGIGIGENLAPRASSAPPAQNQQIHGVNGVPISGRGRPASVDVDPNAMGGDTHVQAGPNPGVHAVTRRGPPQGISYGDISMDPTLQNYAIAGENTPPNCTCSLSAMVICQQCGAFCHADCVSSAKLCVACVIR